MNYTIHTAYSMIASLFTFPSPGADGYQCAVSEPSSWIAPSAIVEQLTGDGWDVLRIRRDGGCWKIIGKTPNGKRAKVHLDPVSGDVEQVMQYGTVVFQKDR
ncbi:MAG: PepSY domain-containing protein [Roseibium sp.]|nr:PepSY domain-containing protein [Roseibium sp.]